MVPRISKSRMGGHVLVWRQTLTLLRLGLKFSFLTKVVVRGELGDPELFLMPEVCFSGIFF